MADPPPASGRIDPVRRALAFALATLVGCATAPPPRAPRLTEVTAPLAWAELGPAAFTRARAEGRLVLLYGAAEWCHWCHVMEAETYADPTVRALLAARFVAVRVDVDARPDIEERYDAWGWPATVLLDADGQELGKYRGFMPAERLLALLEAALAGEVAARGASLEPGPDSAPEAALPWLARRTLLDLDRWYDPEGAGWGRRQKLIIGPNLEVEALRARRGDAAARQRLQDTLRAQRALLDPVEGGVYQYSVDGVWDQPHFEKLMTYQAASLEAYADAFALTGDPAVRADAEGIVRFLDATMTSSQGAFFTNQDADVGAHHDGRPFVPGATYAAADAAARRRMGAPWVDRHVYAYENGLAIAGLVRLYEATQDPALLARARRAARAIAATHVDAEGRVRRAAEQEGPRYLADAAALVRALALLARHDDSGWARDLAVRVAGVMARDFADPSSAAWFASTPDPYAVGVFAARRHAFEHNVLAARALCALADATGDPAGRGLARRVLAAVATPAALDAQGRMLGGFLVALHEAEVW